MGAPLGTLERADTGVGMGSAAVMPGHSPTGLVGVHHIAQCTRKHLNLHQMPM